jgi:hypothetical protein
MSSQTCDPDALVGGANLTSCARSYGAAVSAHALLVCVEPRPTRPPTSQQGAGRRPRAANAQRCDHSSMPGLPAEQLCPQLGRRLPPSSRRCARLVRPSASVRWKTGSACPDGLGLPRLPTIGRSPRPRCPQSGRRGDEPEVRTWLASPHPPISYRHETGPSFLDLDVCLGLMPRSVQPRPKTHLLTAWRRVGDNQVIPGQSVGKTERRFPNLSRRGLLRAARSSTTRRCARRWPAQPTADAIEVEVRPRHDCARSLTASAPSRRSRWPGRG